MQADFDQHIYRQGTRKDAQEAAGVASSATSAAHATLLLWGVIGPSIEAHELDRCPFGARDVPSPPDHHRTLCTRRSYVELCSHIGRRSSIHIDWCTQSILHPLIINMHPLIRDRWTNNWCSPRYVCWFITHSLVRYTINHSSYPPSELSQPRTT